MDKKVYERERERETERGGGGTKKQWLVADFRLCVAYWNFIESYIDRREKKSNCLKRNDLTIFMIL